jgi:ADP-ribosyl-[dinitrogen reductase] hydrolase
LLDRYSLLVIFILDFKRAAGALIGLAIGDALGAPLEGLPPRRRLVTEMEEGGVHGVRRGEVTDDTLQAVAIARSLARCGGFDPADVANGLFQGFRTAPQFYGPTSSAVFALIGRGVGADEAAEIVHRQKGGSRSNGSVMRGAPVGIFFPPARVGNISRRCSRLTHFDPVAGESSAFFNRMVSELCRGATLRAAHSRALAATEEPEVVSMLGSPGLSPPIPSLDALLATHCAVSVLLSSASFEEAVVRGVNLGGDADTVGALCGALAGARWGLEAIPKRWYVSLRRADEILTVAEELYRTSRAAGMK